MNKTKVLYVRIEESDLQLLQEAADALGITVSKLVRAGAREQAKQVLKDRLGAYTLAAYRKEINAKNISYGGVNRAEQATENAGSANPQ